MTDYSEYDALGELFRQRLENHRIPVDDNGWDEISRQIGKGGNNVAMWSWRIGAVAAAASVAALFIFNRPKTDQVDIALVSQQVTTVETETAHQESIPATPQQEMKETAQVDITKSAEKTPLRSAEFVILQSDIVESSTQQSQSDIQQESKTDLQTSLIAEHNTETGETEVALLNQTKEEKPAVTQLFNDSVIPDEDEPVAKKSDKWLLAAVFGMGGSIGSSNEMNTDQTNSGNSSVKMGLSGSDNRYAAELSGNVQSFSNMSREDFSNISHRPPFSFGLTVRKNPEKGVGVESGLVYTYLASYYEWSEHNVHQSLHYIGIPINLAVNLWNVKPNWRIYLSGGFMVEKGLRAVYRQERQITREHRITTVRSHIAGLQGSFNGALGCIYKLEKGWGIYFEPRVGYSFGKNQPVSVRTEYPVYFGINLGLNYEL